MFEQKFLLVCCLGICLSVDVFGQLAGDFRSRQTGNWNATTTWDRFDGVSWISPALSTPTFADGAIAIRNTHTVTIVADVTIDQTMVQTGGVLNIDPTLAGVPVNVTLNNGAGDDLILDASFSLLDDFGFNGSNVTVNGSVLVNAGGAVSINDPTLSTLSFAAGSTYQHNRTSGTIPASTWSPTSTCLISGVVSTAPGGLAQAFGNFSWTNASQTGTVNLGLTSTSSFAGSLSVTNSGTGLTSLNTSGVGITIDVQQDFIVSGTSRFAVTGAGTVTLRVFRDFLYTSSGSSFISTNNGTGTIEVRRNLTHSAGTLTKSGAGSGTFKINGSGTQIFTGGGSITTPVNFTVFTGSALDLGTSALVGTGLFTLQSGATIKVGSPDGLSTGSAVGNIRTTTRTYTPGGNIIYSSTGAQNLGDEWGSTGALNAIAVNLEIANTSVAGVTNNIIGSTSVVGNLKLTSGSLNIGNSNTLQIQSNFTAVGGTIGGDPTAVLIFSGSGTISGNLNFATGLQNLSNFTINRSGTITLGTNLTVAGTLAFPSSGNLKFDGQTLTVNGDITQVGAGGLISTVSTNSNLVIGGVGTLSALPFSGAPQLNNVTLGRTSSGAYTWNTAATVNGTLTLSSGTLTHTSGLTMANNSTFTRSAGTSIATSAPNVIGSNSYNVVYSGTLTTGLELPGSGTALNNLTVSGDAALDKTITINGDLNVNSGTLTAGTFNVTMAGASFLVNAGAFTINAGSLVTFSRPGITTMGGGAIGGTQFGNLTINSGATLSAPNANINVSGTWSNSGTFTANSSTVTFNGASQNLNPNGQAFNNVTFAGTGTKTLTGTLTANGTLTINSTLDVGSNQAINVAGSWVNAGIFTAGGGTVTFNGTAQSINANGQSFFNLTLANSGTKTLANTVSIGGALTINSGVTLDVSPSSYAITLTGNWVNNGAFTRQTGTVTFNGTTVISGSAAPSLNNVTIAGALTTTSGITDVSGNWLQSSGTFSANGGTLQFSGNTQSITPGGQTFNNVTFSGTNTKTLQGAGVIAGALTLTSGTFDSNANTLDMKGNFVSNAASVLTASAITFSGSTIISGLITPTFGGITITAAGTLTPTSNFNVNGNLINNGILNATAGTVTFGGTTTISGLSACTFNNVTISSTNTLTAPSGNISVAGNWSNSGTFNASGGTITFTGTTAFSGTSTTNFANITMSGIVNAPATLNVAGNFTNNGTFNRGTGTVVFNGSSTQSIAGSSVTDFNNITVSNPISSPAVQVQSNQNLRGVLTLSGTNTVFDADGSTNNRIFKVMSSADNPTVDASIATLPTGTSVSGNVTMQRYMSIEGANSNRIYRYISAPVSGAPVSQLQFFIPVTGTFTGASSCSGCGTAQSMFSYDETVITGNLNTGYINFPAAANSEVFTSGKGYTMFVRGNIAPVSVAGSALWELRGPINSGNVSLPVSFTSSGTLANDGWNLVGNPYPSTIDWNAAGWTKTNINNATYVLDNGLATPVYATYIGGVGANGGSRYIAAGQAFFVKSDGGSPVLTAAETIKVAGTQTTFFRQAAVADMVRITLRSGNVADEAVIRFTSDATSAFDALWDAYKLTNPGAFNLSSLTSDDKKLAINAMPAMQTCTASVKLDISNVTAGSYTLDFSDLDGFAQPNTKLVLIDSYTSQNQDVRALNSYAFQVTTDPATFGSNRFSISVGEATATITAANNSVCDKGSVTLTASGATEGNYRWYDSATGGTAIGGATGSTFVTPLLTKSTTYYVAPANTAGCTGQRLPVVADVKIIEPVVLTVSGKLLQSSYAQGNQWYLDGQLIPGATGPTYEPQKTGVYKVIATSATCATSAEREFVITGLEDKLPSHISIYPNPTQGDISLAVKSTDEVSARVLSLTGIEIQNKLLEGTSVKRGTFNLEDQSDGMYILVVQDGNQTYKTRIIKKR